jgi:hypothetical protein
VLRRRRRRRRKSRWWWWCVSLMGAMEAVSADALGA